MTLSCDFFPDPSRAASLDARMHAALASSLHHISQACRSPLPDDADRLETLVRRLEAGDRMLPGAFARYNELVDALQDGRTEEAQALIAELADAPPAPREMQVVILGGAELGNDSARFMRMMNADNGVDFGFQPPDVAIAAAFAERLRDGFDLLDHAAPELAGEIRGIVRQVVISGSDPAKQMQFDGGSHYQLWGALFLNGAYHPDAVAVAEALAHEAAHSLLFGFCTDEPLVENAEDELFSSPLRPDARPMDGIYHATFVSARMHWAMSRLSRSPALSEDQQGYARDAAEADLHNFRAGIEIVDAHGRLTTLGASLMAGAKNYIARAA